MRLIIDNFSVESSLASRRIFVSKKSRINVVWIESKLFGV